MGPVVLQHLGHQRLAVYRHALPSSSAQHNVGRQIKATRLDQAKPMKIIGNSQMPANALVP